MVPQAGQKLSHYRLVEKIGAGGMGVVWKARDERLRRDVALKFLPPGQTDDPELRRRLIREAHAEAAVNHPSIASIFDVGEVDGQVFLAMEYVAGTSLRSLLQGRGLSVQHALRIAAEIAEGLAAAHAAQLVHRDLKPENVMVRADGHVKILDFGLARLLRGQEELSRSKLSSAETVTQHLTQGGRILGTPAYMSPEQAHGDQVDARSDVFSFGTMLYEMMTGCAPFQGRSASEILSAILRDQPKPPSELNPEAPPELDRIIAKCLEKDPGARFQGVDEFLVDLQRLPAASTSPRTSPAGRSRGRRLSLAALIAALLLVVAGLAYRSLRRDSTPPGSGPMRPMMVVLPFENLGPASDEYLADGMTEEISNRLARMGGIEVISRTSAFQYDRSGKTIKQIGADLGVNYVLEGTIRWTEALQGGSRVRVSLQLVRVSDDQRVWGNTYERIVEDTFELQSEIAEMVLRELGIELFGSAQTEVGATPTPNLEAYSAYLRGLEHWNNFDYTPEQLQRAGEMFQRAIDLDPLFALAWAKLSLVHTWYGLLAFDRSQERDRQAEEAAREAVRLAPDLADGHLSLGLYLLWRESAYEEALREFELAGELAPNSAQVLQAKSYVGLRQGHWEEALADLEAAAVLSPRDKDILSDLATSLSRARRYADSDRNYAQAISLAPDVYWNYDGKAANLRRWKGTTEEARAVLERMPAGATAGAQIPWFWQELCEGAYQAAAKRMTILLEGQQENGIGWHLLGMAWQLSGDAEKAQDAYETARSQLEKHLRTTPDHLEALGALAFTYVQLGRREEGMETVRKATSWYPVPPYTPQSILALENRALVYAWADEEDAAIDDLLVLLSGPSWVSAPLLRLDPRWGPLWDHPRFRELPMHPGPAATSREGAVTRDQQVRSG